jgi:hypothetical protein
MTSNGGFPPLKIIKKNDNDKKEKHVKSEKSHKINNINLSIKNILSSSVVKPMIDLNKQSSEKIIDSL